ncbi:titin-like isoform X2 [Dendronephthya gigantea]|uniref:titin-like isoform X2 n=1 Tax=Dendronephthya gigantea TaxID=151771 RepID=UPI0010694444|nr:titin-like isoform X2 [Dendronephthya gigantea]
MEESGNKLSKQRRRRKILMQSDDEDDGTPSKIQSLMPSESTSFSEVERSESSSYTQRTISNFASTAQSKTTSISKTSFSSFSEFEKSSFTSSSHADKHETSYENFSQSNESKTESYRDQIMTESTFSSYSRTEKSSTVHKTQSGELPATGVLELSGIGETGGRLTERDIKSLRPRLGHIDQRECVRHDNDNRSREDRDISIVDTGKSHTYHDISIKEGHSNKSDEASSEHTRFKTDSEKYSYSDDENTKVDYDRSEHHQVTERRGFVSSEELLSILGENVRGKDNLSQSNFRKHETHTNLDELSGRDVELSPETEEETKFKLRSDEPDEMSEMDEANIRNRILLMRAGTGHQYIETYPDDNQSQTVHSVHSDQGDLRQPGMPAKAQMQVKAEQRSDETDAFADGVSETPRRDVFRGIESIETSDIHKNREEDTVQEDTADGVYAEIDTERENEDQKFVTYTSQEETETARETQDRRSSFGNTEDLVYASDIPIKQSESGNVSEEIITIQTGIVTSTELSQPMAQTKESDVPQKMVGSDEVIIIHAVPIRYETRLHNAILTWPNEQRQQTEDKEVKAFETTPYEVKHHDTKFERSPKFGSLLSYAPRPYQKPAKETSLEIRSQSYYIQPKEKPLNVQAERKSQDIPQPYETPPREEPDEQSWYESHQNEDQPNYDLRRYEQQPDLPPGKKLEDMPQSFETPPHKEPEELPLYESHLKDQSKSEVSENLQRSFEKQQHEEPEELRLYESHPNEDQPNFSLHLSERPPDVQLEKTPGDMKQTLETQLHVEPDELMPYEHNLDEEQQGDDYEQPEDTPAGQPYEKLGNIQHPYDTPPYDEEEDELRLHYPDLTVNTPPYGAETYDEPSNKDKLDPEEIEPHVSYPYELHSEKMGFDETDGDQEEPTTTTTYEVLAHDILPMFTEEAEKNYLLESQPHESSPLNEQQISPEIPKYEDDSRDRREEAGPHKSNHDTNIQPLLTENFQYSDKIPVREIPDEERTDETTPQNTELFELPTNKIQPLEDATQQLKDTEYAEQSTRHGSVRIVDTSNENKPRFDETDPVSVQLGQATDEVAYFELEDADSNDEMTFEQILVFDEKNGNMNDGAHSETVLGTENVIDPQHTTYRVTQTEENEQGQEQAEFGEVDKCTAMEVEQTESYNVESHEIRTFQTMSYESIPDDMQQQELQPFESQPTEEQSDDENDMLSEDNYSAGSYNLERRTIRYYETMPFKSRDIIVQAPQIQSFEPEKVEVQDNEVPPTNMSHETKLYQVERSEIRSYESQPYNIQTQEQPFSESRQIEAQSINDQDPEDILSDTEPYDIKRYEIRSYEQTSNETEPSSVYPGQMNALGTQTSEKDQLQDNHDNDDDRLYETEAYDVEKREIRSFETTPYEARTYGMQQSELQHYDVDPQSQKYIDDKYVTSTSDSDEHDTNAEIQSIPESPSRKRKYSKGEDPNDSDEDSSIALHVPIKRRIRITTSKPSPAIAETRDTRMEKSGSKSVSPTREDRPKESQVEEHISASKRDVLHSSQDQLDQVFDVMEYESCDNKEQYPQKPQSQSCDEFTHHHDTDLEMPGYPSDTNVHKYRVDFHIQLSAFETKKPLKSWKSEPILNVVDSTQDDNSRKPWRSKSMNFEKKIPKQSSVVIELQKPERPPLVPAYSTDNLPFETVIRNEVSVKLKNKRRRSFPSAEVLDDYHDDEPVEPSYQNIETEEIERNDVQLTESFETVDTFFAENFDDKVKEDPAYDKDNEPEYEEPMENELVRPLPNGMQTEEIKRNDVQLSESFDTVDTFFSEHFDDKVEEDPAYDKDVKPEYEEPMENSDQSLLKRRNDDLPALDEKKPRKSRLNVIPLTIKPKLFREEPTYAAVKQQHSSDVTFSRLESGPSYELHHAVTSEKPRTDIIIEEALPDQTTTWSPEQQPRQFSKTTDHPTSTNKEEISEIDDDFKDEAKLGTQSQEYPTPIEPVPDTSEKLKPERSKKRRHKILDTTDFDESTNNDELFAAPEIDALEDEPSHSNEKSKPFNVASYLDDDDTDEVSKDQYYGQPDRIAYPNEGFRKTDQPQTFSQNTDDLNEPLGEKDEDVPLDDTDDFLAKQELHSPIDINQYLGDTEKVEKRADNEEIEHLAPNETYEANEDIKRLIEKVSDDEEEPVRPIVPRQTIQVILIDETKKKKKKKSKKEKHPDVEVTKEHMAKDDETHQLTIVETTQPVEEKKERATTKEIAVQTMPVPDDIDSEDDSDQEILQYQPYLRGGYLIQTIPEEQEDESPMSTPVYSDLTSPDDQSDFLFRAIRDHEQTPGHPYQMKEKQTYFDASVLPEKYLSDPVITQKQAEPVELSPQVYEETSDDIRTREPELWKSEFPPAEYSEPSDEHVYYPDDEDVGFEFDMSSEETESFPTNETEHLLRTTYKPRFQIQDFVEEDRRRNQPAIQAPPSKKHKISSPQSPSDDTLLEVDLYQKEETIKVQKHYPNRKEDDVSEGKDVQPAYHKEFQTRADKAKTNDNVEGQESRPRNEIVDHNREPLGRSFSNQPLESVEYPAENISESIRLKHEPVVELVELNSKEQERVDEIVTPTHPVVPVNQMVKYQMPGYQIKSIVLEEEINGDGGSETDDSLFKEKAGPITATYDRKNVLDENETQLVQPIPQKENIPFQSSDKAIIPPSRIIAPEHFVGQRQEPFEETPEPSYQPRYEIRDFVLNEQLNKPEEPLEETPESSYQPRYEIRDVVLNKQLDKPEELLEETPEQSYQPRFEIRDFVLNEELDKPEEPLEETPEPSYQPRFEIRDFVLNEELDKPEKPLEETLESSYQPRFEIRDFVLNEKLDKPEEPLEETPEPSYQPRYEIRDVVLNEQLDKPEEPLEETPQPSYQTRYELRDVVLYEQLDKPEEPLEETPQPSYQPRYEIRDLVLNEELDKSEEPLEETPEPSYQPRYEIRDVILNEQLDKPEELLEETPEPSYQPRFEIRDFVLNEELDKPEEPLEETPQPSYQPRYEIRDLVLNKQLDKSEELLEETPEQSYQPRYEIQDFVLNEELDKPEEPLEETPQPSYQPRYEIRDLVLNEELDKPEEPLEETPEPSYQPRYEIRDVLLNEQLDKPEELLEETPEPSYQPRYEIRDVVLNEQLDKPKELLEETPEPSYQPRYEIRGVLLNEQLDKPEEPLEETPEPSYQPRYEIRDVVLNEKLDKPEELLEETPEQSYQPRYEIRDVVLNEQLDKPEEPLEETPQPSYQPRFEIRDVVLNEKLDKPEVPDIVSSDFEEEPSAKRSFRRPKFVEEPRNQDFPSYSNVVPETGDVQSSHRLRNEPKYEISNFVLIEDPETEYKMDDDLKRTQALKEKAINSEYESEGNEMPGYPLEYSSLPKENEITRPYDQSKYVLRDELENEPTEKIGPTVDQSLKISIVRQPDETDFNKEVYPSKYEIKDFVLPEQPSTSEPMTRLDSIEPENKPKFNFVGEPKTKAAKDFPSGHLASDYKVNLLQTNQEDEKSTQSVYRSKYKINDFVLIEEPEVKPPEQQAVGSDKKADLPTTSPSKEKTILIGNEQPENGSFTNDFLTGGTTNVTSGSVAEEERDRTYTTPQSRMVMKFTLEEEPDVEATPGVDMRAEEEPEITRSQHHQNFEMPDLVIEEEPNRLDRDLTQPEYELNSIVVEEQPQNKTTPEYPVSAENVVSDESGPIYSILQPGKKWNFVIDEEPKGPLVDKTIEVAPVENQTEINKFVLEEHPNNADSPMLYERNENDEQAIAPFTQEKRETTPIAFQPRYEISSDENQSMQDKTVKASTETMTEDEPDFYRPFEPRHEVKALTLDEEPLIKRDGKIKKFDTATDMMEPNSKTKYFVIDEQPEKESVPKYPPAISEQIEASTEIRDVDEQDLYRPFEPAYKVKALVLNEKVLLEREEPKQDEMIIDEAPAVSKEPDFPASINIPTHEIPDVYNQQTHVDETKAHLVPNKQGIMPKDKIRVFLIEEQPENERIPKEPQTDEKHTITTSPVPAAGEEQEPSDKVSQPQQRLKFVLEEPQKTQQTPIDESVEVTAVKLVQEEPENFVLEKQSEVKTPEVIVNQSHYKPQYEVNDFTLEENSLSSNQPTQDERVKASTETMIEDEPDIYSDFYKPFESNHDVKALVLDEEPPLKRDEIIRPEIGKIYETPVNSEESDIIRSINIIKYEFPDFETNQPSPTSSSLNEDDTFTTSQVALTETITLDNDIEHPDEKQPTQEPAVIVYPLNRPEGIKIQLIDDIPESDKPNYEETVAYEEIVVDEPAESVPSDIVQQRFVKQFDIPTSIVDDKPQGIDEDVSSTVIKDVEAPKIHLEEERPIQIASDDDVKREEGENMNISPETRSLNDDNTITPSYILQVDPSKVTSTETITVENDIEHVHGKQPMKEPPVIVHEGIKIQLIDDIPESDKPNYEGTVAYEEIVVDEPAESVPSDIVQQRFVKQFDIPTSMIDDKPRENDEDVSSTVIKDVEAPEIHLEEEEPPQIASDDDVRKEEGEYINISAETRSLNDDNTITPSYILQVDPSKVTRTETITVENDIQRVDGKQPMQEPPVIVHEGIKIQLIDDIPESNKPNYEGTVAVEEIVVDEPAEIKERTIRTRSEENESEITSATFTDFVESIPSDIVQQRFVKQFDIPTSMVDDKPRKIDEEISFTVFKDVEAPKIHLEDEQLIQIVSDDHVRKEEGEYINISARTGSFNDEDTITPSHVLQVDPSKVIRTETITVVNDIEHVDEKQPIQEPALIVHPLNRPEGIKIQLIDDIPESDKPNYEGTVAVEEIVVDEPAEIKEQTIRTRSEQNESEITSATFTDFAESVPSDIVQQRFVKQFDIPTSMIDDKPRKIDEDVSFTVIKDVEAPKIHLEDERPTQIVSEISNKRNSLIEFEKDDEVRKDEGEYINISAETRSFNDDDTITPSYILQVDPSKVTRTETITVKNDIEHVDEKQPIEAPSVIVQPPKTPQGITILHIPSSAQPKYDKMTLNEEIQVDEPVEFKEQTIHIRLEEKEPEIASTTNIDIAESIPSEIEQSEIEQQRFVKQFDIPTSMVDDKLEQISETSSLSIAEDTVVAKVEEIKVDEPAEFKEQIIQIRLEQKESEITSTTNTDIVESIPSEIVQQRFVKQFDIPTSRVDDKPRTMDEEVSFTVITDVEAPKIHLEEEQPIETALDDDVRKEDGEYINISAETRSFNDDDTITPSYVLQVDPSKVIRTETITVERDIEHADEKQPVQEEPEVIVQPPKTPPQGITILHIPSSAQPKYDKMILHEEIQVDEPVEFKEQTIHIRLEEKEPEITSTTNIDIAESIPSEIEQSEIEQSEIEQQRFVKQFDIPTSMVDDKLEQISEISSLSIAEDTVVTKVEEIKVDEHAEFKEQIIQIRLEQRESEITSTTNTDIVESIPSEIVQQRFVKQFDIPMSRVDDKPQEIDEDVSFTVIKDVQAPKIHLGEERPIRIVSDDDVRKEEGEYINILAETRSFNDDDTITPSYVLQVDPSKVTRTETITVERDIEHADKKQSTQEEPEVIVQPPKTPQGITILHIPSSAQPKYDKIASNEEIQGDEPAQFKEQIIHIRLEEKESEITSTTNTDIAESIPSEIEQSEIKQQRFVKQFDIPTSMLDDKLEQISETSSLSIAEDTIVAKVEEIQVDEPAEFKEQIIQIRLEQRESEITSTTNTDIVESIPSEIVQQRFVKQFDIPTSMVDDKPQEIDEDVSFTVIKDVEAPKIHFEEEKPIQIASDDDVRKEEGEYINISAETRSLNDDDTITPSYIMQVDPFKVIRTETITVERDIEHADEKQPVQEEPRVIVQPPKTPQGITILHIPSSAQPKYDKITSNEEIQVDEPVEFKEETIHIRLEEKESEITSTTNTDFVESIPSEIEPSEIVQQRSVKQFDIPTSMVDDKPEEIEEVSFTVITDVEAPKIHLEEEQPIEIALDDDVRKEEGEYMNISAETRSLNDDNTITPSYVLQVDPSKVIRTETITVERDIEHADEKQPVQEEPRVIVQPAKTPQGITILHIPSSAQPKYDKITSNEEIQVDEPAEFEEQTIHIRLEEKESEITSTTNTDFVESIPSEIEPSEIVQQRSVKQFDIPTPMVDDKPRKVDEEVSFTVMKDVETPEIHLEDEKPLQIASDDDVRKEEGEYINISAETRSFNDDDTITPSYLLQVDPSKVTRTETITVERDIEHADKKQSTQEPEVIVQPLKTPPQGINILHIPWSPQPKYDKVALNEEIQVDEPVEFKEQTLHIRLEQNESEITSTTNTEIAESIPSFVVTGFDVPTSMEDDKPTATVTSEINQASETLSISSGTSSIGDEDMAINFVPSYRKQTDLLSSVTLGEALITDDVEMKTSTVYNKEPIYARVNKQRLNLHDGVAKNSVQTGYSVIVNHQPGATEVATGGKDSLHDDGTREPREETSEIVDQRLVNERSTTEEITTLNSEITENTQGVVWMPVRHSNRLFGSGSSERIITLPIVSRAPSEDLSLEEDIDLDLDEDVEMFKIAHKEPKSVEYNIPIEGHEQVEEISSGSGELKSDTELKQESQEVVWITVRHSNKLFGPGSSERIVTLPIVNNAHSDDHSPTDDIDLDLEENAEMFVKAQNGEESAESNVSCTVRLKRWESDIRGVNHPKHSRGKETSELSSSTASVDGSYGDTSRTLSSNSEFTMNLLHTTDQRYTLKMRGCERDILDENLSKPSQGKAASGLSSSEESVDGSYVNIHRTPSPNSEFSMNLLHTSDPRYTLKMKGCGKDIPDESWLENGDLCIPCTGSSENLLHAFEPWISITRKCKSEGMQLMTQQYTLSSANMLDSSVATLPWIETQKRGSIRQRLSLRKRESTSRNVYHAVDKNDRLLLLTIPRTMLMEIESDEESIDTEVEIPWMELEPLPGDNQGHLPWVEVAGEAENTQNDRILMLKISRQMILGASINSENEAENEILLPWKDAVKYWEETNQIIADSVSRTKRSELANIAITFPSEQESESQPLRNKPKLPAMRIVLPKKYCLDGSMRMKPMITVNEKRNIKVRIMKSVKKRHDWSNLLRLSKSERRKRYSHVSGGSEWVVLADGTKWWRIHQDDMDEFNKLQSSSDQQKFENNFEISSEDTYGRESIDFNEFTKESSGTKEQKQFSFVIDPKNYLTNTMSMTF